MKILLIANSIFKLTNFRLGLIHALILQGHDIVAVAPFDHSQDQLENLGVRVINLPMDATGTSLKADALLLIRIFGIFRSESPNMVLGFTIKPNIYGAICARLLRIGFIPNITGLGTAFDQRGYLNLLVKLLYRIAFRRCPKVFLQNNENLDLFVQTRLIRKEQAELLPGSGVDLRHFPQHSLPGKDKKQVFLVVARMLRDKGIVHFVEAARLLAHDYPHARFLLVGPLGGNKAGGLDATAMEKLTSDRIVDYLGAVHDVRPLIAQADCVVLPSFYNEGIPRSLLEAAAMGRPIITTDQAGCREVVRNGDNGFLCRPRDSEDLKLAMKRFLEMSNLQRTAMGNASRQLMEEHFNEKRVINAYLRIIHRYAH